MLSFVLKEQTIIHYQRFLTPIQRAVMSVLSEMKRRKDKGKTTDDNDG